MEVCCCKEDCNFSAATDSGVGDDNDESSEALQRARVNRRSAEQIAKHLLTRLDKQLQLTPTAAGGSGDASANVVSPWEEFSMTSRTNRYASIHETFNNKKNDRT